MRSKYIIQNIIFQNVSIPAHEKEEKKTETFDGYLPVRCVRIRLVAADSAAGRAEKCKATILEINRGTSGPHAGGVRSKIRFILYGTCIIIIIVDVP